MMRVKFHLLPQKVSKLAIQPSAGPITKLVTSADILKPQLWTVDFSQPEPVITHVNELQGHTMNVKILSWSPKGKYLITACDFPILWVDAGPIMKSLERFHHEPSEIHAVEWSPDEKRAIIGTQTNLLYLYEVETKTQLKRLKLDYIPIGIAWDPLNSYIGVLTTENCLTIYTANNLEQKKKVSLNLGSQKFSDAKTKRLDRKISWSPDGEYLVCPSLEDKNELPVACGINRIQNFEIDNVFAGPSAAITCVAFLDMIFKKDKDFFGVFAMGDSDGNISIWQTKANSKPLFYIKGGYEDMSIESISWEPNSRMLFASTTKKFIVVLNYNPSAFGNPLAENDKRLVIETLYGKKDIISSIPASQSYLDKRYLESQSSPVFGGLNGDSTLSALDKKMESQNVGGSVSNVLSSAEPSAALTIQPKKVELKRKGDPPKPKAVTVVEPVRAAVAGIEEKKPEEKKITMEIEEAKASTDKEPEKKEVKMRPKNTIGQSFGEPQARAEKICFPKLKQGLENYKVNILEKNVLTIKVDKKMVNGQEVVTSKLVCLGNMGQNLSETIWTDFAEGKILMIEHNSDYLCYYTDQHMLYINNIVTGKKMELPLMIPGLARMKLNAKNYIMLIREDGNLRVYNFEDKKIILDENCYSLIKELSTNEPPSADSIYLDDDGIPYICLKPNLVVFYNTEMKAWQRIDGGIFSFGIFKDIPKPFKSSSSSSMMVFNKTPKEKFEDFMKEMGVGQDINPEKLKYDNKVSVIRKIEEGMIYSMTKDNSKAYFDWAGIYITKLAEFHEFNKIRCFIVQDLLKNNNSKDYKFLRSKLNDEEFSKFINHLLGKLNSSSEIVLNLRKEIDSVIENLNFKNIFKNQKEGNMMMG